MPEKHFLRRLDSLMDFSFIYKRVENLYSHRGRPSIDPVVIVKMLLLGYLYGIDSERRLEQEVRVNIAYRWFLGIDPRRTGTRPLNLLPTAPPQIQWRCAV